MSEKLIGTKPNQVPTNADLGEMAYQNNDDVTLAAASKSSLTVKRKDDDGDLVKLKRDVTTAGQLGVYASGTGAYLNGTSLLSLRIAGGDMLTLTNSSLYPTSDSGVNLGLSNRHFNNLHMSGTAYIDGGIESASYRHLDDLPDVRPSLLLDFANSKTLDPRITFTRGSTATFFDADSSVAAESNLFTYSQDFSNSIWTTSSATKTSTTETDPANGSTALLLTFNADSSYSLRQYVPSANAQNRTVSMSIWLKGTAGETVKIYLDNGVNQGFDQTITLTSSWAKYSLENKTFNTTSASVTGGIRRTSNETASSVYVAFAQIEERSSATFYVPTTGKSIQLRYQPLLQTAAAGVPRFDHDPNTRESLGLLNEEQRTNIYKTALDWSTDISFGSNSIVERGVGLDGAVDSAAIKTSKSTSTDYIIINDFPVTNGVTYVVSIYVKMISGDANDFGGGFYSPHVDFSANTQNNVENVNGETWVRIWAKGTASSTVGTNITLAGYDSAVGTRIAYFGPQVEAGEFPTSFIPTTSSEVTRNADLAYDYSIMDAGSWFNKNNGTWYMDYTYFDTYTGSPYPRAQFYGVNTPRTSIEIMHYGGQVRHNVFANNSLKFNQVANISANNRVQGVISWDFNEYSASSAINTVRDTSTTLSDTPYQLTRFDLATSNFNAHIKKMAFYPKKLSDDAIVALTEE